MKSRHFGRTLPIPSTLQVLRDLLAFSAAEQAKRDLLVIPSSTADVVVGVSQVVRP